MPIIQSKICVTALKGAKIVVLLLVKGSRRFEIGL